MRVAHAVPELHVIGGRSVLDDVESLELAVLVDDGFVECDRQPAGRSVITEKNIRNRSPSLLSGIPCVDDGGQILVCPIDGKGAAVHEDKSERFAETCKSFEKVFLRFRQAQVCPVTAGEAFQLDSHFLPLQLRGDSHDGDDLVRLPGNGKSFCRQIRRPCPAKSCHCISAVLKVLQPDVVFPSRRQLYGS